MGYYSDVTLLMRKEDFNQMVESFNELTQDLINGADELHCHKDSFSNQEYIECHWISIKWYEELDTVSSIMKYLENADDNFYYEFLRIGEWDDDSEILFNVPDDERYRLSFERKAKVWM